MSQQINASSCRDGTAITDIKNKLEEPDAGKITRFINLSLQIIVTELLLLCYFI